jgi:hypothetical protein
MNKTLCVNIILCLLGFLIIIQSSKYYFYSASIEFPIDYGEGPILEQASLLANNQSPYKSNFNSPPYTMANYPPVYATILSYIVAKLGISFRYGRLLSLFSTLVSVCLIFLISLHFCRSYFHSFLGSILFLSSSVVLKWGSLGRVDSLALTFSLLAIYLYISAPNTLIKLFTVSIFTSLAAFTRQTSFFLPATFVFMDLFFDNQKTKSFCFLFLLSACLLFFAGYFYSEYGQALISNTITANINNLNLARLSEGMKILFEQESILTLSGILAFYFLIKRTRSQDYNRLVFLILGALPSALAISKSGSNVNYLLDLTAALSVTFPFIFKSICVNFPPLRFLFSYVLIFCIADKLFIQNKREIISLKNHMAIINNIRPLLLNWHKNPSAVSLGDDYNGIELLLGKGIYLQPYEYNQLGRNGLWYDGNLRSKIRSKKFVYIFVNKSPNLLHERWTLRQLRLINRNYFVKKSLNRMDIYRPRKPTN